MNKFLIFVFLIFWLFGCVWEYQNHHVIQQSQQVTQSDLQETLKNFDISQLKDLQNTTFYSTPDLEFLDFLVERIDKSTQKVWVEVYIFTEKRLQKALVDAHKRWVDVKIILEKNVYKAPNLNRKTFEYFEKNWVKVVWSESKNYALNHTKMMILDEEVFVSTGNYSYSTFRYNREFFLSFKDVEVKNILEEIFLRDFEWVPFQIDFPNLVLSPFSSRTKLETLISSAQKNILMYSLNFSDKSLKNLLIQKQQEWVKIQIIFPDEKKVDSNSEVLQEFRNAGIEFVQVTKPSIHAKSILVDEQFLYIGSINFSHPSITRNREIGFLLKNTDIIEQFMKIFNEDF